MRRIVKVEKIFHRVSAALAIIQCDKRQGQECIRLQPLHLDGEKAYPCSKRKPLPQPPVRDGINKNGQQDAHETIIHAEPDPVQEWGGESKHPINRNHAQEPCSTQQDGQPHSGSRHILNGIPLKPSLYAFRAYSYNASTVTYSTSARIMPISFRTFCTTVGCAPADTAPVTPSHRVNKGLQAADSCNRKGKSNKDILIQGTPCCIVRRHRAHSPCPQDCQEITEPMPGIPASLSNQVSKDRHSNSPYNTQRRGLREQDKPDMVGRHSDKRDPFKHCRAVAKPCSIYFPNQLCNPILYIYLIRFLYQLYYVQCKAAP